MPERKRHHDKIAKHLLEETLDSQQPGIQKIIHLLEAALFDNAPMSEALYQKELLEIVEDLKLLIRQDNTNNHVFAIAENGKQTAIALIEQSGHAYHNEAARDKLKELLGENYEPGMQQFIPPVAGELAEGVIPINRITINS